MAANEHDGIIYIKDGVCGTIYLTIDSQDPVSIRFFSKIKIQVILGVIKPKCKLKALSASGGLDTSNGISVVDTSRTKENDSLKEGLSVYSDDGKAFYGDGKTKNSEFKKVKESLYEKQLKPVELAQQSVNRKSDLAYQNSLDERKSLKSEVQNVSVYESEQSLSLDEANPKRALRQREQKLSSNQVERDRNTNKRLPCRKIKIRRSDKVTTVKGNSPEEEKKVIDGIQSKIKSSQPKVKLGQPKIKSDQPKVKSDQPKEKRSAKWKLACQISCQYCLKVFENQQAFYDHKKTSRSAVYECCECKKVFPFQAHLQAHEKVCHAGETLFTNLKESSVCICDICGSELKNMFALKKHLMFHTREYFYKCCICGKQFVEPGTLNNHMTTHKSGGMIRCKCCDQLFATRGALAKHKLASMEVKCHLCGEMFPNRTSRTQHYKVLHQNDILKCSKCTSMFSSPEELTVHMKKHNLYKKKQCKTCGKFFSRLEKHVVTHKTRTEIDESELFVCDKCPKKFTNRSSFQRHLTIHSQEKPYQCPNCPRRFADCGVLRKHLRRHMSLMPYECEVCGKKCKEPGNLKVHMRIHSDTKQFQCSLCPQAFNYKSSLEGHMRSRHSQNLSSAVLLSQVPEIRPAYENRLESNPQQICAGTSSRVDPEANQHHENSSWKLENGHNQTFGNVGSIERKEYYENQVDVCMKPVYVDSGANPVNLMPRQAYQDNSLHVNHAGVDFTSKQAYLENSASVVDMNMTSAYIHEGNPIISHHPHDGNPMSVTSLDVTTLNVSPMHVSLY